MGTNRTMKRRATRAPVKAIPTGPDFADTRPTVIVAPDVLGQDAVVVRHPEDTDSEYQSRCELFALLLEHSEKE